MGLYKLQKTYPIFHESIKEWLNQIKNLEPGDAINKSDVENLADQIILDDAYCDWSIPFGYAKKNIMYEIHKILYVKPEPSIKETN